MSGSAQLDRIRVVDLIDAQTERDPDRACLIFDDVELSYREVQRQSIALANGLVERGIGRGAKVALLSTNHPMCVIATIATLRAGAVWVPINPRDSVEDISRLLSRLTVTALAYHSGFADRVDALIAGTDVTQCFGLDRPTAHHENLASVAANSTSSAPPQVDWSDDDIVAIFATGGTTGVPKGVMFANDRLVALARHWADFGMSDGDVRRLAAAPLTHVAGRACLVGMASGVTTVVLEQFDPVKVLDAIEQQRITAVTTPPTLLYKLLAVPDVRTRDYSSLTTIGYGAAPIALASLKEAIDVFGPVLTEGYGQTEAPLFIARMSAAEHFGPDGRLVSDERLKSCGRPTPFADVRILDDAGNELPTGAEGEIAVRADFVMNGYYDDPVATAAAFAGDHLRTGDIGRFDADGFLSIVGRRKEMIISGGFNVYPAEVENALAERPEVREAAVVGEPDDVWGEVVVAYVELRGGASADPGELHAWARARLGGVKAPKRIEIVDELPRNANGKVLKRLLTPAAARLSEVS
ncbi:MAG TPA: AMP-binding protein [Ilumatobacteraceae bacterium]